MSAGAAPITTIGSFRSGRRGTGSAGAAGRQGSDSSSLVVVACGGNGGGADGESSASHVPSANGTVIPQPHAGHFERVPACSSIALNRLPHEPHENLIAIDPPPLTSPDVAMHLARHDISAAV